MNRTIIRSCIFASLALGLILSQNGVEGEGLVLGLYASDFRQLACQ